MDKKERSLREKWTKPNRKEEFFWKQKYGIQLLTKGDKNAQLFHKSILNNRNMNKIR